MFIKTIGMGLILASASILGWYIDRLKVFRIEDLEGLRRMLHMLRGEVSYAMTPLPSAIKEIMGKNHTRVNVIWKELLKLIEAKTGENISSLWKKAVTTHLPQTYLQEEDGEILISFGESLGYLDKEMQKKNIEITLTYIENKIEELNKEHEKNGRLYRSLGILGGCLLCILLY
ncbi:MAG TPA: hypothetical protein GX707_14125 [Epulopiscium sp.]|nr:hypothetical protein [Candidatus Epulonipiscium sp.]